MTIGRSGRLWTVVVAVVGAAALASAGAASASVQMPLKSSPLPGYPRFRGVISVHNGSAASQAREKAIESAVTRAGAEGPPHTAPGQTTSTTKPDCKPYLKGGEGEYPGADLCWWGGSVLSEDTVHLIFWEEPGVHEISPEYKQTIEEYFEHVAAASGANTNVYAVDAQYGGEAGAGEYKVAFNRSADVYEDKSHVLPESGEEPEQCEDPAEAAEAEEICITDEDLRKEVGAAISEKEGWEKSPQDIYFIYTPEEVGGCFYDNAQAEEAGGNECAFETYCAYHSSFYSEVPPKEQLAQSPEYADIPDIGGVEGCDSFEYPNEPEGVDAVLDATSHEHSETITDPLYSYDVEPFELVSGGWLDLIGQEIGDKCLPPETFETYGGALGGSLAGETAFNQIIDGGTYWLQTEWSNRASFGEGRCVQRMVPTEFPEPSNAHATVPTSFEGVPSGEPSDPAAYWVWGFGDGIQVGTPEPTVSHTYGTSGIYTVRLTVYDAYGNSNTFSRTVTVGAAPPPTPPAAPVVRTTTTSVTTTKTVLAEAKVSRHSRKSVERSIQLPRNGRKLPGLGKVTLGRAECPPACGIEVTILAFKGGRRHGHGRAALIGHLKETVANKGTGSIALRLNKRGRRLLRTHRHGLHVVVLIVIEDREGATWTFTRSLRLTNAHAHASRHPRHHRHRR